MTLTHIIRWKEFVTSDGCSYMCSVSQSTCALKFDDVSVIYKERKLYLLEDSRLYELRSMDSTYEIGNGNSLTVIEDGGRNRITFLLNEGEHRFIFYPKDEEVTMDNQKFTPSLFKRSTKLRIGSSHGYGIFTTDNIGEGELVEEIPLLFQDDPYLVDYTFSHKGKHLLALGFGSLYNHSEKPNLKHLIDENRMIISFIANRDIMQGEQCTIDYGKEYFPSRGIIPAKIV